MVIIVRITLLFLRCRCDGCKKSISEGTAMASCRLCDFDLCEACWKPKVPKEGTSLQTCSKISSDLNSKRV